MGAEPSVPDTAYEMQCDKRRSIQRCNPCRSGLLNLVRTAIVKRDRGGSRIRANVLQPILFILLLSASSTGLAQQSTTGWRGVEALKGGTPIRVTLAKEKVRCVFDSADEDGLICHKRLAGTDHMIPLHRTDIQLIRARNLTWSAVSGALIGTGVGAGIGAIVDSRIKNPNTTNNAKFTGGLARSGALLGVLLGAGTEFVPGKVLYRGELQHP